MAGGAFLSMKGLYSLMGCTVAQLYSCLEREKGWGISSSRFYGGGGLREGRHPGWVTSLHPHFKLHRR